MSEEYPDWQDEPVKVVKGKDNVCSIWPADRENPPGWFDVGFSGTKQECLDFVNQHCDGNARLREEPGAESTE
jgi:uncharacterized protein YbdZ (MbtH family)